MSLIRLIVVPMLALLSTSNTASAQTSAEGRAQVNLLPFPLASAPRTKDRLSFLELYQRYYVLPRAYPGTNVDQAARIKAFEQFRIARKEFQSKQPPLRPTLDRTHVPDKTLFDLNPFGLGPAAPGVTDPSGCAWVSRGPTNINGRVTSIAIDPNNGQRIFVTTVGGIWRSLDGGRRWQRVSDDFLSTVFASIAVNPSDGNEIVAGGGDPNYARAGVESGLGIWRSTSGGAAGSWSSIGPPELNGHVIYRLRIDPVAPNNVYAATSNGVYIGTRRGGSIQFDRLAGFDANTNDIVIDFSVTPRLIYAGVQGGSGSFARGIWKYNGTSWEKRDSGIPTASMGTVALALAQSAPGTIYAKIESQTDGRLLGVFKTTSGGETPAGGGDAWSKLAAASAMDDSLFSSGRGYSWYNSVIEVDPSDARIVWAGGLNIYRSPDGGMTWSNVSSGADPSYPLRVHADHHAVAFDPTNPKIVYVGNDGGIDRSTSTASTLWNWRDISHGMILTEFYRMAAQWAPASILAGGSQDNGTEITFGNRTWHNPGGCDGSDVAIDAENASTLYANCNGRLYELVNPVPGTPDAGTVATWSVSPVGLAVVPPLVTDYRMPGAALAGGRRDIADPASGPATWDPIRLLKTVDGLMWTGASPELATNQRITFIGVAPSGLFQNYYVGIADTTGATPPTIWRTTTGGGTAAASWQMTAVGIPNLWPTGIAIDYTDASRAFAAFGGSGSVAMTTDGGASWTPLPGSGINALPTTAVLGVALDPYNANVIYAGTSVGVFKGIITVTPGATPTASWTPFNEGMPDGIDVNGIAANPDTGFLMVATMGHGMYERDIRPGVACPAVFAHVRDNVFDRGYTPSPSDVPDPEFPILDPTRPPFHKPDDTPAGRLYWWSSPDIKVDVPSVNPPANMLSSVDHVEFDTCPSRVGACPPGTLIDSDPRRGTAARVYVQVSNRGTQAASNVRVIALWADATAGLPQLPADFWTTSFPSGGACGAVDTSTGWRAVDPTNPCRTISSIGTDVPEVVRFDWAVPPTAAEHSCILVMIESADQPLDPAIRASNERRLWILVPNSRQIALRNLHVVDGAAPGATASGLGTMGVPNPTKSTKPIELVFSKTTMLKGARVTVVLPPEAKLLSSAQLKGLRPIYLEETPELKTLVEQNRLDSRLAFDVAENNAAMLLPVAPGKTWRIGLVYHSGSGAPNTASRFSVVARQGGVVLGGSTYLLRILGPERLRK